MDQFLAIKDRSAQREEASEDGIQSDNVIKGGAVGCSRRTTRFLGTLRRKDLQLLPHYLRTSHIQEVCASHSA
jgi:hypothetical protein